MLIRKTLRKSVQGDGPCGRISAMLRQVQAREGKKFSPGAPVTESEVISQVGEALFEIFRGCHGDSRKVTMFLRQILLKNFHEILQEVSLICGEGIANQLILFLYDEKSLDEQYKQTNQAKNVSGVIGSWNEVKPNTAESTRSIDLSNPLSESKRSFTSRVGVGKWFKDQGMTFIAGYVQEDNFPFGTEISSFITETQLNQLRVIAMGKILFCRTLQKIPNNP